MPKRLWPFPLLLALLLALPAPRGLRAADAPGSFLVADLDTTPTPNGSGPFIVAALGETILLAARDDAHGLELWASSSATGGAQIVSDFAPGTESGWLGGGVTTNDALYFVAMDANSDQPGLWRSNGTAAGTTLLQLLGTTGQPTSASGTALAPFGNGLIFSTYNNQESLLWYSDGTPAGTRPIKQGIEMRSVPQQIGGSVVFWGYDRAASTTSLWRSDGTEAGTTQLVALCSTYGPGLDLMSMNDRVYFIAKDCNQVNSPPQLWVSDNTVAGTSAITTLAAGTYGLTVVGNTLFFAQSNVDGFYQLWASDGSPSGTRLVASFEAGNINSDNSPRDFTVGGDALFFSAADDSAGRELWRSDGTAAGTYRITDLVPGPGSLNPGIYGELGGNLLFVTGTIQEATLWAHNRASGDNQVLKTFAQQPRNYGINNGRVLGRHLVFAADDGSTGLEPWISDGTVAGTRQLANINPDIGSANPNTLVWSGNGLIFGSGLPWAARLWRATGENAVSELKPLPGTPQIKERVVRGNTLFFLDQGLSLWRSDGTTAGTRVVRSFAEGTPAGLTDAAGTLFLLTWGGLYFDGPAQLWRSDGSAAGTQVLRNFVTVPIVARAADQQIGGPPDPVRYPPNQFTAVGRTLFFSAYEPASGMELWASDGTPGGTRIVKEIEPGAVGAFPGALAAVGNRLFFFTGEGQAVRLWVSDGSAAGTQPVISIPRSFQYAPVQGVTAVGGQLFFFLEEQLWVSNGTANGTRPLMRFKATASGATGYEQLLVIGNTLYFRADDGTHGNELWASDGSVAGTRLVADIWPGVAGSFPTWLTACAGKLAMAANDGVHGRELWVSNGTADGSYLAADIVAGSGSSQPETLVSSGDRVWFSAYDPAHGRELWASDCQPATPYLQTVPIVGAPAAGVAAVPLQFTNGTAAVIAGSLTITATLADGLTYRSDTSGVAPTISGQTLRWELPVPAARSRQRWTLQLAVANAPLGTRFPLRISYSAPGVDGTLGTRSLQSEVMVAKQLFLPLIAQQ